MIYRWPHQNDIALTLKKPWEGVAMRGGDKHTLIGRLPVYYDYDQLQYIALTLINEFDEVSLMTSRVLVS
jgi:hypothetical protein